MDQISREGRSVSGRTPAEGAEEGAVGEGEAARERCDGKAGGSEGIWAEVQPREKEGRRREGQCKAKRGGSGGKAADGNSRREEKRRGNKADVVQDW